MTQKSSAKMWTDESGLSIPYSRTTKTERLFERSTARILKDAKAANDRLAKLKELTAKLTTEAYIAFMTDKDVKAGKGNFTMYNFDRSIKVEVNVNEPIVFDDLGVTAAKAKFDEFLAAHITATNTYVKEMVSSAFETTRSNKLDTKKIMDLIRYKSKINIPAFAEAVALLEQSIRRPSTKTYFKVSERQPDGSYKHIELNFASL